MPLDKVCLIGMFTDSKENSVCTEFKPDFQPAHQVTSWGVKYTNPARIVWTKEPTVHQVA